MTLADTKRCLKPGVPTIVVAWINSSHFELLARIDAVDNDNVKLRSAFDPENEKDLKTIQNLMKSYRVHCKI
jgi:hypothetical protein